MPELATATQIPGGYWDPGGRLHRQARLRPLTGHEEELLASTTGSPTPLLVTAVLGRCLVQLGGFRPVPPDVVRELTPGDRDFLLLQLRRISYGDHVRADLRCPWAECGELVTIQFDLAELPVREAVDRAPLHRLPSGGDDPEIWFRLPDGTDSEELWAWAAEDPAAATTALLVRCITRIGVEDAPGPDRIRDLPAARRAAVEAEMERLAPDLTRTLEARCTACRRIFAAPFDLHRFFFGELRSDADMLYREVHRLAYHYHWSEPQILDLPRGRRQTYLELLGDELERLNENA
jgi:hypothetical protein